jgi:CheY-like chemotaxis protein/CHASE3 domain sensor protein
MLKFTFRQQVFAGFAVSVLLILLVGILSYNSINRLENDSALVDHTQHVIKTSSDLLQLMIDAETGMRGYVATDSAVFLDPYNASLPLIKADLIQLSDLVADNPAQVTRVESLNALINNQLGILKSNIETRPVKGLEYMVQNHLLLNGKHNMDQIRALVDEIRGADNKLLARRKASSEEAASTTLYIILIGSVVFLVIIIVLFFYIQETFEQQKKIENRIKVTNTELEKVLEENRARNWLLTGIGLLNEKMQGQQSENELAGNVLTEICSYTGALTGTFYLFGEEDELLSYYSSYAISEPDAVKKTIKLSEGWIGQVAKDKKAAVIKGKLNENLELGSSVVRETLAESCIVPFFFDKKLKGVFEVAYRDELSDANKEYLLAIAEDIGISVNTAQARTLMHELFSQVQQQAEELQAQQEEMRITNEELMSKTEMLQASEEELIVQQEELRSTNTELEEKASLLEEKNQAIEDARSAIALKVQELETTGKYRSEFLANMSHELRTPLNSILVLARILQDNKSSNLSEEQIKYANVISNAGNDLLTLINDILDLAKIESGKMQVDNETIKISDVLHDMEMLFAGVAQNKKIKYTVNTSKDLPTHLLADKGKLEQVLKNLLSNAFKFTAEKGNVSISVTPGTEPETISFSIKDTGIGIPTEKQKIIFEAFQQADGSTSRRFGGTGLGLSISRELVSLLGGKITVQSEPAVGSEFTVTIPSKPKTTSADKEETPAIETFIADAESISFADDVKKVDERRPSVVIVEDDKNFADILKDYAGDYGYDVTLLHEGGNAVERIKELQPDAVILDIMLPEKDGWQILKELKQDSSTFHIPVHLMSAGEVAANRVNREGAINFLKKPIEKSVLDRLFTDMVRQSGGNFKKVLLIEDNKMQNHALFELMQSRGITVDQAYDGASGFSMLYKHDYQCVILDLNLPDISGLDLLDQIKAIPKFKSLPVIINTAMELDKTAVNRLMKYANAMVVKASKSTDRLIDEVNLFLNKIGKSADQQASTGRMAVSPITLRGGEALKGKKILVVDDDMRNVFALTSVLESYDINVEIAEDGQQAIDKLQAVADIDLVLMDIMMPVMDGYEAMQNIRKQNKFAKLPIIALTAKAMKDDKDKCIAAGANDYITKPVDIDRLISLMKMWLSH